MKTRKALTTIAAVLMLLNGLFFMSNIYVLGDTPAAIAMHDDLAPDAGHLITQGKVINCFLVGLGFVLAGIGLLRRKRDLLQWGFWGALLFLGFYIVELILWGGKHQRVWLDFAVFGGVSALWGCVSFRMWRKGFGIV